MANDNYFEAPPQGQGGGGMIVPPLKLLMMQSSLSISHVQGLGAAGTPSALSKHKWHTQATSDSPAKVAVVIQEYRTINKPQGRKY